MFGNIVKMFLLVISFTGSTLIASEKKSLCNNPGCHRVAIVGDHPKYTLSINESYLAPAKNSHILVWKPLQSGLEKFIDIQGSVHSVEWQFNSLKIQQCDGNVKFIEIK